MIHRLKGSGMLFGLLLILLGFSTVSLAQSVSNGSISGTVTDPSGATVPSAKVTVTNTATGQSFSPKVTDSGTYNSGPLQPGIYKVRVEAAGFSATESTITVQVGVVTNGNVHLQVGKTTEVVEVQGGEVMVNTEQPSVQGVLTGTQMENLPVNGRNFLDFAQLEPGVQIQDGTNFDPTKVGFSSISFGGRFGRTARISVDGVDVSDETVGTTTTDIPASAISEFQIAQSTLDLSNDLTSSGAVNVTTRSGTNQLHGELFDLFRDSSVLSAQLPTPPGVHAPFQRSQFGGRLGGPIIKDKLFWFIDGERTLQNLQAPVLLPDPFTALSGTFNSPYRETNLLGRMDYQLTKGMHLFYRFSYFDNRAYNTFFSASFQVYQNKDVTRDHVVGLDWTSGSFTHSVRFSYLKFQNQILDGSQGQPFNTGLTVFVGNSLAVGPNFLAPQSTPQSDHQIKYDGAKTFGRHVLRYGADFNHLQGGGYASFFSISPEVIAGTYTPGLCGACPGGQNNYLNYPVSVVVMGNGQGYSTTQPAFGFPAGGLGPDNRIGLYVGDNWKAKPNLTITAGVRYDRDTGRTDSDLPGIPALNSLVPGMNLGAPVHNPNLNFAPQLGVAWDPSNNGKTVIRAGIGLFYENTIWNNVLFDRPSREPQGAFLQTPLACLDTGVPGAPLPIPNGSIPIPAGLCSQTIGQSESAILALEKAYAAASPFQVGPNPGYLPSILAGGQGPGYAGPATFAPNFKSPRSLQMNIGFQHELRPGTVFSADFIRNVTTHYLLGQDYNHTGDARYFNMNGALQAIAATVGAGCTPAGGITQANASAAVNCYMAANSGAAMTDFANNGLTATTDLGSVSACPAAGCAFGGINPAIETADFLAPIGRSVYNGLQMKLAQNVQHPMKGIRGANFQIAYSLSRFVNAGGANPVNAPGNPAQTADQDFIVNAPDQANTLRYMGPSLLDRTHQLSFGGTFDVPAGFRVGIIAHFYSPLAEPLVVSNTGLGAGEIFRTDFTGDGTTQDYLPGTKNGSYMRDVSVSGLNGVITQYNNNYANQATPAGQVLINNGLFTLAQLQTLGGVAPAIAQAPQGQVGLGWLRAFDLSFRWDHTFKERITIEPSVSFFNILNFANFNLPPNIMNPYLSLADATGAPTSGAGAVNTTTYFQQTNTRVGTGTGVFGLGAPRATEFGLRVTF